MLISRKFISAFLFLSLSFFLSSCASYRSYPPNLSKPSAKEVLVSPPVLLSVVDSRDKAGTMSSDLIGLNLCASYSKALKCFDSSMATPPERLRLRIKIHELGAHYSKGVDPEISFEDQFKNATAAATDIWSAVVKQAYSRQTTVAPEYSTEHVWVGTVWLEMEIEDLRFGRNIDFSFPIIAEQSKYNPIGFMAARSATKKAWLTASDQLFSSIDDILQKANS